jgi:hypothetical protein
MLAPQEPRVGVELPAIRRFDLGDLPRHGAWLVPRLTAALGLPEQRLGGWLRSMIDSSDYMFLVQEHSAGLAELQSANGLADKPVIKERFVLAEDPDDAEHVKEAAAFYTEMARWAKNVGAEIFLVEEMTNVPHEMIKEKLGRIYSRQQQFARV